MTDEYVLFLTMPEVHERLERDPHAEVYNFDGKRIIRQCDRLLVDGTLPHKEPPEDRRDDQIYGWTIRPPLQEESNDG